MKTDSLIKIQASHNIGIDGVMPLPYDNCMGSLQVIPSDTLMLSRGIITAWKRREAAIAEEIEKLEEEAGRIGEKLKAARVLLPNLFEDAATSVGGVVQSVVEVVTQSASPMSPADIRAALIAKGLNIGQNPASLYTYIKRASDRGLIQRSDDGYTTG